MIDKRMGAAVAAALLMGGTGWGMASAAAPAGAAQQAARTAVQTTPAGIPSATAGQLGELTAQRPEVSVSYEVTAAADASIKAAGMVDGVYTAPTIQQTLDYIASLHARSAKLLIKPGTYREKLRIDQPSLMMAGTGDRASDVCIVFNDVEGTPLRPGDEKYRPGKKDYGMECSTVSVLPDAKGFTARNITFVNDFDTERARAQGLKMAVQGLAFRSEADQTSLYGCRFIGRQDTLMPNAGRQYYRDCYIAGDVDFIFGAATAVFEDCTIEALPRRVSHHPASHGYITAPSTLTGTHGYLLYKCRITGHLPGHDTVYLGRPWHPSSVKEAVNSEAVFRECSIDVRIAGSGWHSMGNKYGTYEPEDSRMFEYRNTGEWADESRRQLADKEAVEYTPEGFLGAWYSEVKSK